MIFSMSRSLMAGLTNKLTGATKDGGHRRCRGASALTERLGVTGGSLALARFRDGSGGIARHSFDVFYPPKAQSRPVFINGHHSHRLEPRPRLTYANPSRD